MSDELRARASCGFCEHAYECLKGRCTNGSDVYAPPAHTDSQWGEWMDGPLMCPGHTAVCGMRMRFEPKTGSGDETAANRIEYACCQQARPSI